MIDINTLVKRSHELSVSKGWYDGAVRGNVDTLLSKIALIHSELSEAWEESESGRYDVWYQADGKPEGVVIELADAAIRAADLIGWLCRPVYVDGYQAHQALLDTTVAGYMEGVRYVADSATELIRRGDYFGASTRLAEFILEIDAGYCDSWKPGTLAEAIDIKHEFNRTRPRRHGGKLA